jgi:hypothetical protein
MNNDARLEQCARVIWDWSSFYIDLLKVDYGPDVITLVLEHR